MAFRIGAESDEGEGSLLQGRVNRRKQAATLAAGKIERSAEALQTQSLRTQTITL